MPLILYADDICLIADSAADLQRMLSVSQKFADESSFQFSMEKSQVVVFGPDAGDRFADEFRLMGTLMDVVSEYKYLGLILHESLGRRTGPGSGLAYGAEKEKYLYKRLLDNDEASQAVDFESCLARRMSTLRNYELWTYAERTDLPAYLKRRCPLGSLREGRRLKTKLCLGCHPLRSRASAARMSLTRNAACS